jgi:glycosyl transferase family 25
MKIYVINLPASRKRLQNMKRRLDSCGLRYEVIQAVSAADIDADMVKKINQADPRGGPLKPGEVACARSHLKALRKMIDDEEDVGIVLEDDVIFHRRFSELVKSISAENLSNGPLLLCALFFKPTRITKSDHLYGETYHYEIEKIENVWGAMAYAIKRDDAKRMSAQIFNTRCRSDDWQFYINIGVIENITLCFPFAAQHEELNSDIAKFARLSSPFSIPRISMLVHRYRIFPFFQISIALRQRRAEKRQFSNIIEKSDDHRKMYQLK